MMDLRSSMWLSRQSSCVLLVAAYQVPSIYLAARAPPHVVKACYSPFGDFRYGNAFELIYDYGIAHTKQSFNAAGENDVPELECMVYT